MIRMEFLLNILVFALISCPFVESNAVKKLVGLEDVMIGFGNDCYLWSGGSTRNGINGEFRCGRSRGIRLQIVDAGNNHYYIRDGNDGFYWNGQSGHVKNGEFRRGQPGDIFWIHESKPGLFAIGFSNCPLFWRGDSGNIKNAEFRCGKHASDLFWLKDGTADPRLNQLLDFDAMQIGFGENCFLFWRGDSSSTKNAEFRCGVAKGDPMKILAAGRNRFRINSNGNLKLFWAGQAGSIKNGEFRKGSGGDTFWIQKEKDGLYSIGFGECPLFWRGDKGNTKNAEFRCGQKASDFFWIKGGSCKVKRVRVLDDSNTARYDGEEIVGIVSAVSCSKSQSNTLRLSSTKEVTEETGIELAKTKEINWQITTTIEVEAGFEIFGVGGSVSVSHSLSTGGSISFSSTTQKSTTTGTSSEAGLDVTYDTPGSALIVGTAKRYVFDKSNIPTEVTVTCDGGYAYKYDSSIKLRSKRYSQTNFNSITSKFAAGKCTSEIADCIRELRAKSYKGFTEIESTYKKCIGEANEKKQQK